MATDNLDILLEDNHLLVVNKPALLPTMGAAERELSLVKVAKDYLKRKYAKPGNVYLGVVSRLDAHVTGAVILARTSKAAARLTRQFQKRSVSKTYWAVVEGESFPESGEFRDWLRKNDGRRRMEVCSADSHDAKEAVTQFTRRSSLGKRHWVELHPLTGRKHQLRVQLAHRGHPIIGDRKYDSAEPFSAGIALHSRAVSFEHPVQKTEIEVVAKLPPSWRKFSGLVHEGS